MYARALYVAAVALLLVPHIAAAQFPVVVQGDFIPNDSRLRSAIGTFGLHELTIASFNIRNLGNQKRSLKDFTALVDLMDEADVVLIQEAGLGSYSEVSTTGPGAQRMEAAIAVLDDLPRVAERYSANGCLSYPTHGSHMRIVINP